MHLGPLRLCGSGVFETYALRQDALYAQGRPRESQGTRNSRFFSVVYFKYCDLCIYICEKERERESDLKFTQCEGFVETRIDEL